jgi:ELWxxDGT repeat protein
MTAPAVLSCGSATEPRKAPLWFGTSIRELWVSDGTALGTYLLSDIFPGERGSLPRFLTSVGWGVFFAANDGFFGNEPWLTQPEAGPALGGEAAAGWQQAAAALEALVPDRPFRLPWATSPAPDLLPALDVKHRDSSALASVTVAAPGVSRVTLREEQGSWPEFANGSAMERDWGADWQTVQSFS